MNRLILPEQNITPQALQAVKGFHSDVVQTVADTVQKDSLVVVGMAQNPVVKKARKALDDVQLQYTYLEYGSYVSAWHKRLAIKLWSGWPTFPQVFAKGLLIGGYTDLQAMLANGELKKLLASSSR